MNQGFWTAIGIGMSLVTLGYAQDGHREQLRFNDGGVYSCSIESIREPVNPATGQGTHCTMLLSCNALDKSHDFYLPPTLDCAAKYCDDPGSHSIQGCKDHPQARPQGMQIFGSLDLGTSIGSGEFSDVKLIEVSGSNNVERDTSYSVSGDRTAFPESTESSAL